MTRIIRIESCHVCPHSDHNGGFGSPARVPVCTAMRRRELPYVTGAFGSGLLAIPVGTIPMWCPLEPLPVTRPLEPKFEFKRPDDTEGGSLD